MKGLPLKELIAALLIAIACVVWAMVMSGCTTTIYRDGKPIARFQGNMTDMKFNQSATGVIEWEAKSVSHSTATLAAARAISSVTIPAASVLTTNQFAP